MLYSKHVSTRKTDQSQPILGREKEMAENNAGGFVFTINDWMRLERFLVLGTEGGTYYVGEQKLTRDNAQSVMNCIKSDGKRVVDVLTEISGEGRAINNDSALFVLAMCASLGDNETRSYALAHLNKVARIGTHLFHFAEFVKSFRGWGRGLRDAIANWYNNKDIEYLSYQVMKYQQRDGWSHGDLLKLAHPKPRTQGHDSLYAYLTGNIDTIPEVSHNLSGWAAIKKAESATIACGLIEQFNLPREVVPTHFLKDVDVWKALLAKMPITALIRNLGKMTNVGALHPLDCSVATDKITNQQLLKKGRVHPIAIINALKVYANGRGFKGKLHWDPLHQIIDALDEAFYMSFKSIEPTGKRIMLALDVSGSMTRQMSNSVLNCREASAVLAMVTARVEKNWVIGGFTADGQDTIRSNSTRWYGDDAFSLLPISPRQRLDDVTNAISGLSFGATDCALPMRYALEKGINVDAFVIYTDNETWCGSIHPVQALKEYRSKVNANAKLVVVGMVSTEFSIADPNDAGMLDVVGFDTATPQLISNFIKE